MKAELLRGSHRYDSRARRFAILRQLFSRHHSFPFDDRAAEVYGRIRQGLEAKEQVIGAIDMLIAAIALANDLTLVTHSTAEFSRIDDLKLEDWTVPAASIQ